MQKEESKGSKKDSIKDRTQQNKKDRKSTEYQITGRKKDRKTTDIQNEVQ